MKNYVTKEAKTIIPIAQKTLFQWYISDRNLFICNSSNMDPEPSAPPSDNVQENTYTTRDPPEETPCHREDRDILLLKFTVQ